MPGDDHRQHAIGEGAAESAEIQIRGEREIPLRFAHFALCAEWDTRFLLGGRCDDRENVAVDPHPDFLKAATRHENLHDHPPPMCENICPELTRSGRKRLGF